MVAKSAMNSTTATMDEKMLDSTTIVPNLVKNSIVACSNASAAHRVVNAALRTGKPMTPSAARAHSRLVTPS